MLFNIKKSPEVSPILGFLLVIVTILLSSIVFSHLGSFQSLISLINPHNQTAQVSGTVGNVFHFSSCPASKSLYTDMFSQLDSRISKPGVNIPPDATTNASMS